MKDTKNKKDTKSTKACRLCKRKINIDAEKCYVCGSYQNWRRHLSVANLIIAISLGSLIIFGKIILSVDELFYDDNSNIQVEISEITTEDIILVATNSGSKPGIITDVKFSITGKVIENFNPPETTVSSGPYLTEEQIIIESGALVNFSLNS